MLVLGLLACTLKSVALPSDRDGDGFFAERGDCDDSDAGVHPGADEACDGVDNDCDDQLDDGLATSTWYEDSDSDGFGADAATSEACRAPVGYTASAGDCDDDNAMVSPSAPELCNGVDDNCDGVVDPSTSADAPTWYADADGDGHGTDAATTEACAAPEGYAASEGDCDDDDAMVSPTAPEVCNGVDDNCDGVVDPSTSADAPTWYADADGDGYGADATAMEACTLPEGFLASGGDCDDARAEVNPAAVEVCEDGLDNDCDGSAGACAPANVSLADADVQFTGEAEGDHAGWSVAGAGDVNWDGYADLLVGAPEYVEGGAHAGAAWLILGSPSPTSIGLSGADAQFTGDATTYGAGSAVAGAGDVNADGYADILVGAQYADSAGWQAGAAYLILGSRSPSSLGLAGADAQLRGEDESDWAGASVAGVGDVDADGYADLLLGAPHRDGKGTDAGAAYLVRGGPSPTSIDLASADAMFAAEAAYDFAGWSVAGAGDVDADGYADLLVGAHYHDDGGNLAGAAYLVLGSPSPTSIGLSRADAQFTGEAASDYAGESVAGAGDVDADGYADLLIAAQWNDDGGSVAGAVYLVLGGPSPMSLDLSGADAQLTGEGRQDEAGCSVAAAGDVDGDGHADLLVGAVGNDDGGEDAGAAYLVRGSPAPLSLDLSSADTQFSGQVQDYAGHAVAGAGDVDADGYGDLLVGAAYNADGGRAAGAAYLVLGTGW